MSFIKHNGARVAEKTAAPGTVSHRSHNASSGNRAQRDVTYHGSSTAKQLAGAGAGGDAGATPSGGQPAPSSHPFAKPPLPKKAGSPIDVTRGMRGHTCRMNDPQRVVDQATKSGGKC